MKVKDLRRLLDGQHEESEIKAIKLDDATDVRLVIIPHMVAVEMNELLEIEPHIIEEINEDDEHLGVDADEEDDEDDTENQAFLREQGIIGSDYYDRPF